MGAKLILTGKRFGKLLVVKETGEIKEGKVMWSCLCDCGKSVEVRSSCLNTGHTQSCGCYQGDVARDYHTTHGDRVRGARSSEYTSWAQMIGRCTNPNHIKYRYWGGRGISVCERWRFSFQNFLSDMGPKPSRKHTLDRYPDMNGNYGPSNCRWATKKQQAENRRSSVWVEYNGEKMTIADWARRLDINRNTFADRIAISKNHQEVVEYYLKKKAECLK